MALYLAIDAGGTRTRCAVADDTRTLASCIADTVKLASIGQTLATQRLAQVIQDTVAAANVQPQDITRTCIGLAGISSQTVRSWAQNTLSDIVAGDLLLCGDDEIALDAAFGDAPGIIVLAGTGSNVMGRASDGMRHRVGGWGPLLGDEGSGTWIGREAVRAALQAHDREEPTTLGPAILNHWQLSSLREIPAHCKDQPQFAQLTPLVSQCATAGDALAKTILTQAGRELAHQVLLLRRKLQAIATLHKYNEIAYTGSIMEQIAPVRSALQETLQQQDASIRLQQAAAQPLNGALWRARHPA